MSASQSRFAPSPHRLDALSDGVFAIVLTLLALELRFPDATAEHGFLAVFLDNSHVLESFVIAFFVVGALWRLQHLVNDQLPQGTPFVHGLTLSFLATVTLTPWSLDNLTSFPQDTIAVIAFSGTLLVSWLLLIGLLSSALRVIEDGPAAESIRRTRLALLAGPGVAILSIALSPLSTAAALYVWLLLLPYGYFARRLPYVARP